MLLAKQTLNIFRFVPLLLCNFKKLQDFSIEIADLALSNHENVEISFFLLLYSCQSCSSYVSWPVTRSSVRFPIQTFNTFIFNAFDKYLT